MYTPRQIGIPVQARNRTVYTEYAPAPELGKVLFYTWELKTLTALKKNVMYLILPDICTDIIFDLYATAPADKVLVMKSGNNAEEVMLGKDFHFLGLRFLPGVIQETAFLDIQNRHQPWQQLKSAQTAPARQPILESYIQSLLTDGSIIKNYLMHQILLHSDELHKVSDLQRLSGYTPRQLQRIFTQQTGFAPRDFLKILRFQQLLANISRSPYADQSHLIKEFKRITGLTPKVFEHIYGPMSD